MSSYEYDMAITIKWTGLILFFFIFILRLILPNSSYDNQWSLTIIMLSVLIFGVFKNQQLLLQIKKVKK